MITFTYIHRITDANQRLAALLEDPVPSSESSLSPSLESANLPDIDALRPLGCLSTVADARVSAASTP